MDQLEQFFSDCKRYRHYENITPRPENFRQKLIDKPIQASEWICKHANLPSLKLRVPIPRLEEMAQEAEALLDRYVDHRGDIHPGWSSICIHGAGATITNDWRAPEYNFTEQPEYKFTEIADQCPATVEWIKQYWTKDLARVRFMLLAPGGYIRPHNDYDGRELNAINVAITNPPGVEFAMEDAGLIPWKQGDVRAIDIGRQHSVRNLGDQNRIHMIIHGRTENWSKTICESYEDFINGKK